jgi:6-phosphogluconolactonase (cycloisomerase 2 family)
VTLRGLLAPLAAAVAGLTPGTLAAGETSTPTGSLSQLSGPAGCVYRDGRNGCAVARYLDAPRAIEVSRNGSHVYVGFSYYDPACPGDRIGCHALGDGVMAFARDRETGGLSQLPGKSGCLVESFESSDRMPGDCEIARGVTGPTSIVVSAKGKSVYIGRGYYPDEGGIAAFARDPASGALEQLEGRRGCVTGDGRPRGCARGRGISEAGALAFSPGEDRLYAGAFGIGVFARDRRTGALSQMRGRRGCVLARSRRCTNVNDLYGAQELAAPSDGRHLYSMWSQSKPCFGAECFGQGDGGLSAFRRLRSGALRRLGGKAGCISYRAFRSCRRARAVDAPEGMVVSPDGKNLYLAAIGFATDHDAVAVFKRNRRSGRLRQLSRRAGCVGKRRAEGCTRVRALDNPVDVAVSPDGRNVYVASLFSDAVAVFARERARGKLRQLPGRHGCVGRRPREGCSRTAGLSGPQELGISPDGRHVYVLTDDGIEVFQRKAGS